MLLLAATLHHSSWDNSAVLLCLLTALTIGKQETNTYDKRFCKSFWALYLEWVTNFLVYQEKALKFCPVLMLCECKDLCSIVSETVAPVWLLRSVLFFLLLPSSLIHLFTVM